MRKIFIGLVLLLLCGCVSISEQSSVVEVDDSLQILIVADEAKQEFVTKLKRQLDSSIQINETTCETSCEIISHPDLILAIGPITNMKLDTSIPVLRIYEHEATLKDKITFLQQNSAYQKIVAIGLEAEGVATLPFDEKLEENLKKYQPDAVILNPEAENLMFNYPVVLSEHPQNQMDVVEDETKMIETIVQTSQLIFHNQTVEETIPLCFAIRGKE